MTPDYEVLIDWDDDGDFDGPGEDVSSRTFVRSPIDIQYGRDQARSLSPPQAGTANLELDNTSRDYSPENPSSPLAGQLKPGRRVLIRAEHDSTQHVLYRGYLDDYALLPDLHERSVRFTVLDGLARLRDVRISTPLRQGIRTGQAVGLILDAAGWPAADRDLDLGGTIIRYWWEDDTDAFTALERVMTSEGPPALVTVDTDGRIVFRDRHHRLVRAASLTPQATFGDHTGPEPVMSPPLVYDLGWRDVVNSVSFDVLVRQPEGVLSTVFSSSELIALSDGETRTITARASGPFVGAVTPEEDLDYEVQSGAVTTALSRTSGQSVGVMVTAVGGPAVVAGMSVRAYDIPVVTTTEVRSEEAASIGEYGRRSDAPSVPWVGVHDASAVGQVILAHRAERQPIVQMRLTSGSPERLTQQLGRDLSDRVTIVDPESGLDADFHIEQIRHSITGKGDTHESVFGCEKVPTQIDNAFQFDVPGAGFDDGRFGLEGLSDPDTIFRFDVSGQGFDDGFFAY